MEGQGEEALTCPSTWKSWNICCSNTLMQRFLLDTNHADTYTIAFIQSEINLLRCLQQVRYKMHNEPPPTLAPRGPPARRISTRRSSYAFSHSQGYGKLVTSRKFLLRPLRPRPALFIHPDSAVAQSQPQYYRTITEEPEGSQSPEAEGPGH